MWSVGGGRVRRWWIDGSGGGGGWLMVLSDGLFGTEYTRPWIIFAVFFDSEKFENLFLI